MLGPAGIGRVSYSLRLLTLYRGVVNRILPLLFPEPFAAIHHYFHQSRERAALEA
jgi:hypothetical protein